jgi:anti-sigma-K factor RskA
VVTVFIETDEFKVGEETPQANAKVVWNKNARQWAIYIFDLPAPPSDMDYQLWYVTKNAKISAAVFRTDERGRTVLNLTPPPDALADLAATAVTLEPRGGSPQPTGKFYLKARSLIAFQKYSPRRRI